ncbi:hypothetical protein F5Y18DRAFT_144034 [Xylariaceae sp. FL1019]|nr:hypothetical protein F5Y18DRAFT_144034 [Xylariaceae sp. FL1019]
MGAKRQNNTEEPDNNKKTVERSTNRSAPASASTSATAPKRQRVSRACDQCRAAREKCDGIQPLCFACASQNRSCSWEEPKKKRGVQTGYIRTLEMALGWIFDKIPESEEALHGLLTHEGGQGRLLFSGKDSASAGTRLCRRWRKSTVHREIERVLSGGDAAYARAANDSTPGDESDEEDLERRNGRTSPGAELRIPMKTEVEGANAPPSDTRSVDESVTPQVGNVADLSKSSLTYIPQLQPPQPPYIIVLPHNHWRLLDIYFSYTHCWFPILEKHEVLKTSYTYPDEGLPVPRDNADFVGHAELWAALTLASYQERASEADVNVDSTSSARTQLNPGEMYQVARKLVPLEHELFEVRHVNALLLLTLVNIGCDDVQTAWFLIGVASRMSLSLRLHESSSSANVRQSSHTYMGCFILDTLISARLGLVPHLRADMAQVDLPRLDNDLDEWQPWMPCSDFGPSRQTSHPSRMPSHSVSSFRLLYRIHHGLSRQSWDGPQATLQAADAFLSTLQNAVSQYGAEKPLSSCILSGERLTGQSPSTHLLRLSFLSAASRCRGFPNLHQAVLGCVESYIGNFGICGLPPTFPVFMNLVIQHGQSDPPSAEERNRWKQAESAMESVWPRPNRSRTPNMRANKSKAADYPNQPAAAFSVASNVQAQQSANAALFHSGTAMAHNPASFGSLYAQDHGTNALDFVHHTPTETHPVQFNGSSTAIVDFDDMDTVPGAPHFTASARPSFSSAALDYDTILDDMASIDHTNMAESDPQFMANLGLRPGTNFADVFSHDFMGFS